MNFRSRIRAIRADKAAGPARVSDCNDPGRMRRRDEAYILAGEPAH